MYKKILTIVITLCLIFLIFSPNALSNEIVKNDGIIGFRSIFAADPLITVEYEDVDEPVIPNYKAIRIYLQTSYELVGPNALRQLKRLRNKVIPIELTIQEQPDWCEANIENSRFNIKLGDSNAFTSTLQITVTEEAPANTVGNIIIRATSEALTGLFFTNVKEGERTFDIGFVIGYWTRLSIDMPMGSYREIPAMRSTKIPIIIENLGNGPTLVDIEIIEKPKKWSFSIPSSVQLGSQAFGEVNEKEINLIVSPPKDFSRETVRIIVTPSLLGDPSSENQTETIILNFKNDGSYKEDGPNIFLIIIIIIVIILIILVSFFTKRKYYKK